MSNMALILYRARSTSDPYNSFVDIEQWNDYWYRDR